MDLGLFFKLDKMSKNEGVYVMPSEQNIDYPESGYDDCLQIEDDSFWFRHRNRIIEWSVKKYSPDKTFFDIGGGNGFVSLGLQRKGIKTVLLEPGYAGCINARNRGVTNVICSVIENDVIQDNSIESAGLFDVIEHIESDLDFLLVLNSKMKKDGLLYITVPAYKFLWSFEDDYTGHYRRYTLNSLKSIAEKAGFGVVRSSYLFSILPLPIYIKRVLMNKGQQDKPNNKAHSKSLLSSLSNLVWRIEEFIFKVGIKIPFGSSCYIILIKKEQQ